MTRGARKLGQKYKIYCGSKLTKQKVDIFADKEFLTKILEPNYRSEENKQQEPIGLHLRFGYVCIQRRMKQAKIDQSKRGPVQEAISRAQIVMGCKSDNETLALRNAACAKARAFAPRSCHVCWYLAHQIRRAGR